MKKYKIVFLNLIGTLINTMSGKICPIDIWDISLNFRLIDKLKQITPDYIFIIINQNKIEKDYIDEHNSKNKDIVNSLIDYINKQHICKKVYTCTNNINNYYQKDNTKTLKYSFKNADFIKNKNDICMIGNNLNKEDMLNNLTAINFGIDYYNVNDFIN